MPTSAPRPSELDFLRAQKVAALEGEEAEEAEGEEGEPAQKDERGPEEAEEEGEEEEAMEEGEGERTGEGEEVTDTPAAMPVASRKRKLINQFNFCERAALTYTNPKRVWFSSFFYFLFVIFTRITKIFT